MDTWEQEVKEIRKSVFLTAYSGGMAHIASAFSCIEILYALYFFIMRYDSKNPQWLDRDRLILSKGHGSLALYVTLQKAGFFSKETLQNFIKPESLLGGEPSLCLPLGIEASSGSLGHGLSLGVGMSLALKTEANDARVFVLVGDGECEEGSVWEAIITAAKYKLDNLILIMDKNGIQKMDTVQRIANIDNWYSRFSDFGWDCLETKGHDVPSLVEKLRTFELNGKPHILIADTIKGKGVSLMENNPSWHWRMPNRKELKVFINELKITPEELDECKKHI